jgi:hypothetical protein
MDAHVVKPVENAEIRCAAVVRAERRKYWGFGHQQGSAWKRNMGGKPDASQQMDSRRRRAPSMAKPPVRIRQWRQGPIGCFLLRRYKKPSLLTPPSK